MGILAKLVRKAKRERRLALQTQTPKQKSSSNKAALQGRHDVLSGKRPPLKHAICFVLGDSTMDLDQVYAALSERGWLPAGANPKQYVGGLLSGQKRLFPRVQRGIYQRAANWEELIGPHPKARSPLIDMNDLTIPKCWRVAFMLEANPILDYATTAQLLYGKSDEVAKNRVNALMSTLRNRGVVRATGERTFEVNRKALAAKSGRLVQRATD